MRPPEEDITRVLDVANKVANKDLVIPEDGDLLLEEFRFDSLTLLAFVLELEDAFGVSLDDALLDYDNLRSIYSVAVLMGRELMGQAGCVPDMGATSPMMR